MTVNIQINFGPTYPRPVPLRPGTYPAVGRPQPRPAQFAEPQYRPAYRPPAPFRSNEEVLAEKVEQFIVLATALDCVVLQSETEDQFVAISAAAVIQADGCLPPDQLLKIQQAFEIIRVNFNTEGQVYGGKIGIEWPKLSKLNFAGNHLVELLRSELQTAACPGCGRRLAEAEQFHWCPFCGQRLMTAGRTSDELRACLHCSAAPEPGTTWIYHSTCRHCPRCGERLKVWRGMRSDSLSSDRDELLAGVDCANLVGDGDLRRMPHESEFEIDSPEPVAPVISHKPSGKAKKARPEPQPEPSPAPEGQK